jgi:hypothetical protein
MTILNFTPLLLSLYYYVKCVNVSILGALVRNLLMPLHAIQEKEDHGVLYIVCLIINVFLFMRFSLIIALFLIQHDCGVDPVCWRIDSKKLPPTWFRTRARWSYTESRLCPPRALNTSMLRR